jgi:hypothetical protein
VALSGLHALFCQRAGRFVNPFTSDFACCANTVFLADLEKLGRGLGRFASGLPGTPAFCRLAASNAALFSETEQGEHFYYNFSVEIILEEIKIN